MRVGGPQPSGERPERRQTYEDSVTLMNPPCRTQDRLTCRRSVDPALVTGTPEQNVGDKRRESAHIEAARACLDHWGTMPAFTVGSAEGLSRSPAICHGRRKVSQSTLGPPDGFRLVWNPPSDTGKRSPDPSTRPSLRAAVVRQPSSRIRRRDMSRGATTVTLVSASTDEYDTTARAAVGPVVLLVCHASGHDTARGLSRTSTRRRRRHGWYQGRRRRQLGVVLDSGSSSAFARASPPCSPS